LIGGIDVEHTSQLVGGHPPVEFLETKERLVLLRYTVLKLVADYQVKQ
jgi:hypothetical protein